MASLLPHITMGTPTGIEGVVRVTVEVKTLMHQDHSMRPVALPCLVN